MEYLLPYLCMVTVPHIMVGLERMLRCRIREVSLYALIHFNLFGECLKGYTVKPR